jgi:tetratricopeptide (TPR) repeat protein
MNGRVAVFFCISSVLTLGIFLSCGGGGGGGGPEVTAEQLTSEGWARFEAGDFQGAMSKFEGAIAIDSNYGEAYNGLGWSCVKIDSLEAAVNAFGQAISKGVSTADPRAGKAVVYRDLEPVDFQASIDWADSALARDSDYVFSHDTTMTWKDLRLILAQSYYGLHEYEEALEQVDILDPENTLNSGSDTFVEDLLAELQRLGEEI